MAFTTTETKVSVPAGKVEHTGTLEVGYEIRTATILLFETPPPYDYDADAEAVFRFLHTFLPDETFIGLTKRFGTYIPDSSKGVPK